MGGMMNIVANLLAHRQPDGFCYHAVLTHNHLRRDARFRRALAADTQTTVEYTLPIENLHAVMRRVARAIPPGGGVYVAGDLLDLAVASAHDVGRAVIYMLHGDTEYYYDLAARHDPIVHAYIAYSRRMYEQLLARLPHRAATIFHLPYGIPLPPAAGVPAAGPLRVDLLRPPRAGQKGVFDLPEIDRALQAQGLEVSWTVIGAGPDEAAPANAVGIQSAGAMARAPLDPDAARCVCRAGRLRSADALRGFSRRAGRSDGRRARAGRQRHRQRRPRSGRQGTLRRVPTARRRRGVRGRDGRTRS